MEWKEVQLKDIFSSNIKKLRGSRGWNQAELARRSKITPAAVSQLEKGKRSPTVSIASKIAVALDIDTNELFAEENVDSDKKLKFYKKFKLLNDLSIEDQEMILNIAKKLQKAK